MKIKLKYFDPTDASTLVNKGTGKHIIADGMTTIPVYKGKLYSIKDVVNEDGTVNVRKAKKIMEEVAEYFGGKKMQNRPENPAWHKEDPNTWLHTKKVAKLAWDIPAPEGYTKQDLMIAALGHDFGKIISGDGHAEVSYNLIKQIFPDATEKLLNAIRRHMDPLEVIEDKLGVATKFADLGVTPTADLTTLGLNPEELAAIEKTKWFKKGGNINYFINGGVTKKAVQLTLFPEIEELAAQLIRVRNSEKAKKAAATRKAKFEALPEFEQEIILNDKALAKKQRLLAKDVEESQKAIASGKFVPETKWDPEEWLQMRRKMDLYDPSLKPGESYGKPASETNPKGYTTEDIELFKLHIPELQALEFRAKKEGTWMKNSDSSDFNGDPRIWLMWQLENTKHYLPQTLWTGMNAEKAANFMTYDGRVFSTAQQSSDFGGHSIPFRTSTSGFETFDAEGRTYDLVLFKNGVRVGTDKLLADTKGRGIIVNNVNENWGDVGDAMGEAVQGASKVTDYAFNSGHPRWFLHGNTGNFNIGFNKQGGSLIPKNIGGGNLLKILGFSEKKFGKLAGGIFEELLTKNFSGNDAKLKEATEAAIKEKIINDFGEEALEDKDFVIEAFKTLTKEDILRNMPESTSKKSKSLGNFREATEFSPQEATIGKSEIFGDTVHIDLNELTMNGKGFKPESKVSIFLPISQATDRKQVSFNGRPIESTPDVGSRTAGFEGSKGKQEALFLINDSELADFKKEILVPTAQARGANGNQAAYIQNHGTAGILEKAADDNLKQSLSTKDRQGFARLNKVTNFDSNSGAKIKSLLVHETLGHGLEGFLKEDYLLAFNKLPGLKSIVENKDIKDIRAMMLEAKYFLWKLAKKVSNKATISPEELNEFISKVPEEELIELFKALNHQGASSGTGTRIAKAIEKNGSSEYRKLLGTMLGAAPVAVAGAVAASEKEGGTIKMQEGGAIVVLKQVPGTPFRHLLDGFLALDFDDDLERLYKSRKIKNGALTEKAEKELLKKYNLNSLQLQETLDDLFNEGFGEALFRDLQSIAILQDEEDLTLPGFKNGGRFIKKADIGSKIIGGLEQAAKTTGRIIKGNLNELELSELTTLLSKEKLTKPEKLKIKELRLKEVGEIVYTGDTHSISEVVSETGKVNWDKFEEILKEIHENIPELPLLSEISSKNKRHILDGTPNTLEHSKAVAKSAQTLGITKDFSKLELVTAALFHDIGQILSKDEHLHGALGEQLLKLVFPDITANVLKAINSHMDRTITSSLLHSVHAADLMNGSENIMETIARYPKAGIDVPNVYNIPKVKTYTKNGVDHFIGAETSGRKHNIIPRNTINGSYYPYEDLGDRYTFKYFNDKGTPLVMVGDNLHTYEDAAKNTRILLEKSGDLNDFGVIEKNDKKYLAGLPIQDSKFLLKAALDILESEEYALLKSAAKLGNRAAQHVLLNLKFLTTHSLEGIEILGGGSAGVSSKTFHRFTAGQLSEIVDLWKNEGYRGIVTPLIKGSENFLGRNSLKFTATGAMSAGNKLFLSNSPIVALRYSDIRVLKNNTTWELLLEGLTPSEKTSANAIRQDILKFCKTHNIKQGNWDYSWLRKSMRSGTSENLIPELYEHPDILRELLTKFDNLLHVLGKKNLGIGGTRRAVGLINPKSLIGIDYRHKRYQGWLDKEHPLRKYFKGGDHNAWTDFLDLLKFQQGITANIGETIKAALDKGAPYGADFMLPAKDIRIASWKKGGSLN